jgi:glycerol 2-dehydrogenase (NADP+)
MTKIAWALTFACQLVKLTSQDISAIDNIHEQKGKHRSLVSYQSVFSSYHDEVLGGVLGWTYEQLGWTGMKAGGVLG